jgi:predicted secreted protein
MAGQHGKDAVFKLAKAGNTLTDVSRYTSSTTIDRSREATQATTYQPPGDAQEYIVGLRDGTFSANGTFDGSAGNIDDILSSIYDSDDLADFEAGPEGSASGKVKYTGQAILTTYTVETPVDGLVTWSAEFQISEGLNRSTY